MNNTTLVQVRITSEDKAIAQAKLSKIGLTVPDFLRISIKQFNLTGQINLQSNSVNPEDEEIKLLRLSASKLNDKDWIPEDATNYKKLKPVID